MAKSSREHVYGLNPAFEVLRAGKRRVYSAHLNEGMRENARIKKLLGVLERGKIEIEWTDKGRLMQISGSRDHQGVVLKTSLYPYAEFDKLLGVPRMLMLDNVEDPHNVGAILRSAEVFGFSSVCLPKKGVPEIYPSVVKVSAGATEFRQIVAGGARRGQAGKTAARDRRGGSLRRPVHPQHGRRRGGHHPARPHQFTQRLRRRRHRHVRPWPSGVAHYNPTVVHTGIGYDVHRLLEGRPLWLGGVEIEHDMGLDGHSDADVLMHAICDAVLGALGQGDIGSFFPPSEPQWKDAPSRIFLEKAAELVAEADGKIVNIDATLIAEAPKILPHVPAMKVAVAQALYISPNQVGIKATTNELLGFLGRGEGMAAMAVAGVNLPD